MKKGLILLPLLAGLALGGCSLFNKSDDAWVVVPEIKGGSKAEKNAILRAVNDLSPCVNTTGSATLFPTATNISFDGDEQDAVRVLNRVQVDDLTVELTWDFPAQSTYDGKVAVDDNTDIHYIKYPGVGGEAGTFNWSLSKIVCGKAVSTKTNCDYTAKVMPLTREFKKMTLPEIYSVTDDGADHSYTVDEKIYHYESISNIINYDYKNAQGYSPWWKTGLPDDSEKNYIFAEVTGKVVFLSEDGNWGLLANGDHVIEIYSGNTFSLKASEFPELKSEYVTIKGEVSHYYGNFQFSYIKSIRAASAEDKAKIVEPNLNNFNELTEAKLASSKLVAVQKEANVKKNYVYKQFSKDFEHNGLVSVTGTITGDKVNGSSGRFTFELTVAEGYKVEIQYDYHTDKDSQVVKNALLAKYVKNATVTIKGTLRVTHGVDKTLVPVDADTLSGTGVNLSIVPFAASHIA